MADFTSAEIQAFKKMSDDEMIEYYNKTGINVMALDLKTIVASDLAEAIKDDTTDGATIEEKIERQSAHPMAKGSYKMDKTLQNKTETFTEELEKDTVKNADTTEPERNETNVETKEPTIKDMLKKKQNLFITMYYISSQVTIIFLHFQV